MFLGGGINKHPVSKRIMSSFLCCREEHYRAPSALKWMGLPVTLSQNDSCSVQQSLNTMQQVLSTANSSIGATWETLYYIQGGEGSCISAGGRHIRGCSVKMSVLEQQASLRLQ